MIIDVSCGCNIGRLRKNNEDNFYFCGKGLPCVNSGLSEVISEKVNSDSNEFFAVFDGMGGEESGEVAAYVSTKTAIEFFKSTTETKPEIILNELCTAMNLAVCRESRKLDFGIMGSTVASVMFSEDKVYCCNIGDSRVYRHRDGELFQMSIDHVEKLPLNAKHKARLIQHLGIPEDEMQLEPYIALYSINKDDYYLICSDGITDMLADEEISSVIKAHTDAKRIVEELIAEALKKGGKDNITVIVCRVN